MRALYTVLFAVRMIIVALVAAQLTGGSHAAVEEKTSDVGRCHVSQRTNLSDPGAHGGLYAKRISVAGCGAETSALMRSAQKRGPRATEWWRSDPSSGVAQPGSARAKRSEVARSNRVTAPRSGCHEKSTRFGVGNGAEDCIDLSEISGGRSRSADNSTRGSDLSIAGWRNLVAHRAHNPGVRGSNPRPASDPKQLSKRVVRAQQQESATRLASVALSVTGSAAAQPDSTGGVS